MKKIFIPSILVIVFLMSFATKTYAVWWNPGTWFKTNTVSTSSGSPVSNQQLLDRITELENKVNEQSTTTSTVATPAVTQTSSDSSLQNKIVALTSDNVSLKAKLAEAQNKYASCQANLSAQTSVANVTPAPVIQQPDVPATLPITPVQRSTPYDYTNYSKVNISDYVKNPTKWLGWGVEVMVGQVDDFMAAGDRGVSNNYIEITDDATNASLVPDKMMVLVQNDDNYRTITDTLKKGDIIDVYGIGSRSQQFRTVGSADSTGSYEPVVTAQRVDKCMYTSCSVGNTSFVFDLGTSGR